MQHACALWSERERGLETSIKNMEEMLCKREGERAITMVCMCVCVYVCVCVREREREPERERALTIVGSTHIHKIPISKQI